ncbi:MAG: BspA family leucine-rich repeat surface protein [Chitinophagia bacterium]|nr:BspA family leucine-rich repeat surface protein [Chitinophagia bacterium]
MASSYNYTTRSKRKRQDELEKVKYDDKTLHDALEKHRADIERGIIRITNWDVSNVTYMQGLFFNWSSFNQPLNWDTSKVQNMAFMFSGCTELNQPLLLNTSEVTTMAFMFDRCGSFDQDLEWDTSRVTNMECMFSDCTAFNMELRWDTSNVKSMKNMFKRCAALEYRPVFDMSGEPDTDGMFDGSKVSSVVDARGGLMSRRLSHGRRKEWTDNGNACGICLSDEPRVVVHEPEPTGSEPHAFCGKCIENHIISEWKQRKYIPTCPTCHAPFDLLDLQKTAFGRYAMKLVGHKQRAEIYRKLLRHGPADAHDARARAYSLGAARILRGLRV